MSNLGNVTEDFNSGSWGSDLTASTRDGSDTLQVTSQQLEANTSGDNDDFALLVTTTTHDFTGAEWWAAVVRQVTEASIGRRQTVLAVRKSFTEWARWRILSNSATVQAHYSNGTGFYSTGTQAASLSHTADFLYLRVREDSGTIYWDSSPDGETWTNRASVSAPWAVTDMEGVVGVTQAFSGGGTIGQTALFDDIGGGGGGGGATPQAITGTLAGTSTASLAAPTLDQAIAGTAAGTSTATLAAPVLAVPLSGTAGGTSTATAAASTDGSTAITGTLAGTSTATLAAPTLAQSIAGTAAGTSDATASPVVAIAISGGAAGTSTMSGAIGTQNTVALSGTLSGSSTATATAHPAVVLTGTLAGSSTASGAYSLLLVDLTGTLAGTSSLSGLLGDAASVPLAIITRPLYFTRSVDRTLAFTRTVTRTLEF